MCWTQNLLPFELRCGNVGLRSQTGAWTNELKESRTCKFCCNNVIEDKTHIILHCSYFSKLREEFYSFFTQLQNHMENHVVELTKLTHNTPWIK